MRVDGDGEHLGADAAIEAFDHAVGLRRAWLGVAILRAQFSADPGKGLGEAAAVVCQDMCHAKGKSSSGFTQEGDGTRFGFVVLDGEMNRAQAAVDGDVEIALAPFAIDGLQLGEMLDVDMDEAEVIVLEGALAFSRLCRCRLGAAVQPLGLEDAPDAVAIEMRQEMADDKGQVIEGEVGEPTQCANNGALLPGGLPGRLVRSRRMVQTVCRTPLAPLADGLGGHAIALGEDAGALVGIGDLGTGDRRGAGVRMDLQHHSDLPLSSLYQAVEQIAVADNSMPHRIPTMFRNLTKSVSACLVARPALHPATRFPPACPAPARGSPRRPARQSPS